MCSARNREKIIYVHESTSQASQLSEGHPTDPTQWAKQTTRVSEQDAQVITQYVAPVRSSRYITRVRFDHIISHTSDRTHRGRTVKNVEDTKKQGIY